MAIMQINFHSQTLVRHTTFHMLLPNDAPDGANDSNPYYQRPVKTLFLLHGYSGDSTDWMMYGSVHELSQKYNLAIVMPSGENGFFVDGKGTGHSYGKYLGEELPAYLRKTFGLAKGAEDTLIGGLSMGGFGSIRTALKYPESFGSVIALSSALIIHNLKDIKPGTDNGIADYDYYTAIFGDLSKAEESEFNPEFLIHKLKQENKSLPRIYMACGTEDFLLRENRQFRDFLVNENVGHSYNESKGVHDWNFWSEHIEPGIKWCLSNS